MNARFHGPPEGQFNKMNPFTRGNDDADDDDRRPKFNDVKRKLKSDAESAFEKRKRTFDK